MKKETKHVSVVEKPLLEHAESVIRKSLLEHRGLLVIGSCEVDYRGRASSKLEAGDRIVIIKEDGAILVHRPTEYSPVNWQPPGCLFETRRTNEGLSIRAVRRKPREVLEVNFKKIYVINTLNLTDKGVFHLFASEEDMQKAIVLNPSLIEPGLRITSIEKKVEPGFVDLCGLSKEGRLVIIEIKRKTAGKDAAIQLAKYVEAIKPFTEREIRGILAAPNIAKDVQPLLATLKLEFKPLSPKKCAETLNKKRTAKILDYLKTDMQNV